MEERRLGGKRRSAADVIVRKGARERNKERGSSLIYVFKDAYFPISVRIELEDQNILGHKSFQVRVKTIGRSNQQKKVPPVPTAQPGFSGPFLPPGGLRTYCYNKRNGEENA